MIIKISKAIQLMLIVLIGALNLYVIVDLIIRMIPWDNVLFDKYFDFIGWVWTITGFVIVISTIPAFIFQKHKYISNGHDEQSKLIGIRKLDKNGHVMFIGNILFGVFSILEGSMIVRAGLLSYALMAEVNARNIIVGIVVFILGLSVVLKYRRPN